MRIPSSVKIIDKQKLSNDDEYQKLVNQYDVVQIAPNRPFWVSGVERKIYKAARTSCIYCIAGISSNRAMTTLLNSKNKNILKRIKSWIIYFGINLSIRYFTRRSDGVFVVGIGLVKLINPMQTNIFINTASWINDAELIRKDEFAAKVNDISKRDKLRLCVATRLEYMKGVHIALDALKILKKELGDSVPKLLILGEGEELEPLKRQAEENGLTDDVVFGGIRSYPDEFFKTIRAYDLMLLTNLNDEQPRLVFDSISQGVIPICPNSHQFEALKMDDFVYYEKGNPGALAAKIREVISYQSFSTLSENLHKVAGQNTIDTMHRSRADWIKKTISNFS